jgi:metal-responsive CopG/Arc/MetJ family transcriptional regulator
MATQTFNLSMPSVLVDEIDEMAKLEHSSRSEFIRSTMRDRLTRARRLARIQRERETAVFIEEARELEVQGVTDEDIDKFVAEMRHR